MPSANTTHNWNYLLSIGESYGPTAQHVEDNTSQRLTLAKRAPIHQGPAQHALQSHDTDP